MLRHLCGTGLPFGGFVAKSFLPFENDQLDPETEQFLAAVGVDRKELPLSFKREVNQIVKGLTKLDEQRQKAAALARRMLSCKGNAKELCPQSTFPATSILDQQIQVFKGLREQMELALSAYNIEDLVQVDLGAMDADNGVLGREIARQCLVNSWKELAKKGASEFPDRFQKVAKWALDSLAAFIEAWGGVDESPKLGLEVSLANAPNLPEAFVETIKKTEKVSRLRFRDVNIDTVGRLAQWGELSHVEEMEFRLISWNEQTKAGLQRVLDLNPGLTSLSIRGSHGCEDDWDLAWDQRTDLKRVALQGIGNEGIPKIRELALSPNLEELDLSDGELDDKGLKALLGVLKDRQTPLRLSLSGNRVSPVGYQDLYAFSQSHPNWVLRLYRSQVESREED